MSNFIKFFVSSACGVMFGFSMEKGRVFEPAVIRSQMALEKFLMMKMFLSAVASGIVGIAFVSMVKSRLFQTADNKYRSNMSSVGEFSVAIGGALLGAGMTLSGACPGMVMVQIGAGVLNAPYTILGGIAGALVYGFFEPLLRKMFDHRSGYSSDGAMIGGRGSYVATVLPFAAILGVAVYGLEHYYAWRSDIRFYSSFPDSMLKANAWPPYVAGAAVGALQVPIMLTLGRTLGSSGAYRTIAAQLLCSDQLRRDFSYLNSFRTGIENWWQVGYVLGAAFGGFLSSSMSGTIYSTAGAPMAHAFLGGFLMIFGSSLGSGCTSGHGLSGMAFLNQKSMVAVVCMFAGGIATSFYLLPALG